MTTRFNTTLGEVLFGHASLPKEQRGRRFLMPSADRPAMNGQFMDLPLQSHRLKVRACVPWVGRSGLDWIGLGRERV
jgi:hypothetical protein